MPDPRPLLRAGIAAQKRGEMEEAARIFRQVLRVWPGHPQALHLLGVVAHGQGDPERAISLIERALPALAGKAHVHNNLANALAAAGRREEALLAYRQALHLAPGYATAHYNLGRLLGEEGDLAGAREHYGRAVQADPGLAGAWLALAQTHRLLDQAVAAIACYGKALELRPDDVTALVELAALHQLTLETPRGLPLLERALAVAPEAPLPLFNLAQALAELGETARAEACHRRVLALEPDNLTSRLCRRQGRARPRRVGRMGGDPGAARSPGRGAPARRTAAVPAQPLPDLARGAPAGRAEPLRRLCRPGGAARRAALDAVAGAAIAAPAGFRLGRLSPAPGRLSDASALRRDRPRALRGLRLFAAPGRRRGDPGGALRLRRLPRLRPLERPRGGAPDRRRRRRPPRRPHRLYDLFATGDPGASPGAARRAAERPGDGPPARMGASIVRAAGLGELVADSVEEYVETAAAIAASPSLAASWRRRVEAASSSALFDLPRWTRGYEAGLAAAWELAVAGEPGDVEVASILRAGSP